jgi:hypothetical protein
MNGHETILLHRISLAYYALLSLTPLLVIVIVFIGLSFQRVIGAVQFDARLYGLSSRIGRDSTSHLKPYAWAINRRFRMRTHIEALRSLSHLRRRSYIVIAIIGFTYKGDVAFPSCTRRATRPLHRQERITFIPTSFYWFRYLASQVLVDP